MLLGAAAALVPIGCGETGGQTPDAPAPDVPAQVRELTEVHDEVRVSGLDDRRFAPATFWSAVEPALGSEELQVEEVGRSAEGRPLRSVSFGSGPIPVLLWSQMHGDESTATMALADIFALVAERPDDPLVRTLRERLTVHAVPVLNPDGAERFQRRNAQGVDVNRDARRLATPEGRTLKEVRDRVEPRFAFNLHDQNVRTRVGDTDRGVAIALLAPAFDESRAVNDVRRRAMELSGMLRAAIEPLVGDHIARYDDTFEPRAFGDLMTQWGASTVLIESGGWEDDPQKQYLRKVNFVAILASLEAIASGRFEGTGTARYDELPPNGRRVADLLVSGGTLVVGDLPPLRADLLVNYRRPLLETGGRIVDIGDLDGREARDTIGVEGLYVVADERALEGDDGAQLQPGAPARFTVSERPTGAETLWRFDGGPPPEEARGAPGGRRR